MVNLMFDDFSILISGSILIPHLYTISTLTLFFSLFFFCTATAAVATLLFLAMLLWSCYTENLEILLWSSFRQIIVSITLLWEWFSAHQYSFCLGEPLKAYCMFRVMLPYTFFHLFRINSTERDFLRLKLKSCNMIHSMPPLCLSQWFFLNIESLFNQILIYSLQDKLSTHSTPRIHLSTF